MTKEGIFCCTALDGLKNLPDNSVDMVLTSPPYWKKRDYGEKVQLGQENTCQEYLTNLVINFQEVQRVLKKQGTCWINLGDVYQAKSQLCLPERFALLMIERGWILRNKIIWHKSNHMPSPVKDRLTNSWEYLLLFTKSRKYYFDLDAIRLPHKVRSVQRLGGSWNGRRTKNSSWEGMEYSQMCHPKGRNPADVVQSRTTEGLQDGRPRAQYFHPNGKNPGDFWTCSTNSFRSSHPAAYPESLCEMPIQAGCPLGGIVLDPFVGSGTTSVVAKRLGRRYIGFDLNPDYVKTAKARLSALKL